MKAMTMRLPDDLAEKIALIASVDGKPVSEEVRDALAMRVAERIADPEFQARLQRVKEANAAALSALSAAPSGEQRKEGQR